MTNKYGVNMADTCGVETVVSDLTEERELPLIQWLRDLARISSLVNKGLGQTVKYQVCTSLLRGSEKLRVHLAVCNILHCALSSQV